MGMAATQARLLQLTSELNDLEFQGQQINQARSVLSSQSATYYNQLLNMEVPIAPSKADYMTTVYSYTLGNTDYTISNIVNFDENGNGTLMVSSSQPGAVIGTINDSDGSKVTQEFTSKEAYIDAGTGKTVTTTDKNAIYGDYKTVVAATGYTSGATYLDEQGNDVTAQATQNVNNKIAQGGYIDSNGNEVSTYVDGMQKKGAEIIDENGEPYDPPRYESAGEVTPEEFADCVKGYYQEVSGESTDGTIYYIGEQKATTTEYYLGDGSDVGRKMVSLGDSSLDDKGDEITNLRNAVKNNGEDLDDYYVVYDGTSYVAFKKEDIEDPASQGKAKVYQATTGNVTVNEQIDNVKLTFGSDGRLATIQIPDADGNYGSAYTVTSETITDEVAYEEANAEYTYDKALYDKEQARINGELSTIQSQDKKLELQLQELDTKRTQITTERDALDTVLGDNTERTYKTFSG